jgi:serine protease Do
MVRRNFVRPNTFFWIAVVVGIAWLGMGDRLLSHWAYAVERGRVQADAEELAELADIRPELQTLSRAFRLVAKIARHGVVHIEVEGNDGSARGDFEAPPGVPEEQIEQLRRRWNPPASGSGVVLDNTGHVLTNNHVVAGRRQIRVKLNDSRVYDAIIVGTDPKTDLAVLKIEADNLHPLRFGDSDKLDVGDWVIAVGAPFGLEQTVTHGIVSATGRSGVTDIAYQDFIQTDAAINPGNSGGPLLNLSGEVVGINTAIATRGDGNQGIAFTIPANLAVKIANELKVQGKVTRGYLGIQPMAVAPADKEVFGITDVDGVLVNRVIERSPASRGGLEVEDIIVGVNDLPITSLEQFRLLIAEVRPYERAKLSVIRDGERQTLYVRLDPQPENLSIRGERTRFALEIERLGMLARTLAVEQFNQSDRGVVFFGWTEDWDEPPRIRPEELIVACNGERVRSVADLRKAIKDVPRNRKVNLTVLEPTGDKRIVAVRLDARR